MKNLKGLSEARFLEAIGSAAYGLRRYQGIQKMYRAGVSVKGKDFQRAFNGFYRVRRSEGWQRSYYDIFELAAGGRWSFEEILKEIFSRTGRVEASFASKMCATINEESPVIDSVVLKNFSLKMPNYKEVERFSRVVKLYDDLGLQIAGLLESETGRFIVREFKRIHSVENINPVKVIDLTLWRIRDV